MVVSGGAGVGSDYELRILTERDVHAYRELRLEALRLEPTAFGSSYEQESARDVSVLTQRVTPTEDSRVFGAFYEGSLVGTAGLRRDEGIKSRHKAFIWGVYVTLAHRNRGLGRRLMNEALSAAGSMPGLARVTIAVNAANVPARSLYEDLGFVAFGLEPDALRVGEQSIDELWMSLALA